MQKRCTPQSVKRAHRKARTWRNAAEQLNQLYGVNLSHTAWRDFADGRRDITDPETRARLGLRPRACPGCGHKHITRKRGKPRRIREYGYPTEQVKSFAEVLILREAPR